MNKQELKELKDYYGTKLRKLHKGEPFEEINDYEEKLSKIDYSYEEWNEIIENLGILKEEALNAGDFNPKKFEDLNVDPLHFFYELLQNADDCNATEINIEIDLEKISFKHNGSKLFSLKDLLNICSLGQSDKESTKIGKFGIGFKTVFSFCEKPIVKCPNGCNFRLKDVIVPEFVKEDRDKINTSFIFHIDRKKNDSAFYNKLELLDIDWNILLFLNKIYSISVINNIAKQDYSIIKEGSSLKKDDSVVSSWLIKVYELKEMKEKYNLSIVPKIKFAIYLENNILLPLKNSHINKFYLYMPLESEINPFKYLIHADFECVLNRGSFSIKDYNKEMFQSIKEKMFELIESLSKNSEYAHCFLNILPLPQDNDKFSKSEFFSSFPEEISNFVKDKIIFTDNFGGKIETENTPFIVDMDIIELMKDDGALIRGVSKKLVDFNLHSESATFIKSWKIMPFFGIREFVDEIKTMDLSYKPSTWFVKLFINFNNELTKIENEINKENTGSEKYAELKRNYDYFSTEIKNLKIYRDNHGNLGSLSDDGKKVVKYFFLPDDEKTSDPGDFEFFHMKLTFLNEELHKNENEELTPFFEKIGVNKFEPRSIINSYILIQFDDFIDKLNFIDENDLIAYTTYIFKKYLNDKEILDEKEILNNLRERILLRTKNNGNNKWAIPKRIYFSSEYFDESNPSFYLEEIFSTLKSNFLDPIYIKRLNLSTKISVLTL